MTKNTFAAEAERALDILFNPDNIDKLFIKRIVDEGKTDQLVIYVGDEPLLLVLQENQRRQLKAAITPVEIH